VRACGGWAGRRARYCDGAYCVLAHDAVQLLTAHGRRATRLTDGMLDGHDRRCVQLLVESGVRFRRSQRPDAVDDAAADSEDLVPATSPMRVPGHLELLA